MTESNKSNNVQLTTDTASMREFNNQISVNLEDCSIFNPHSKKVLEHGLEPHEKRELKGLLKSKSVKSDLEIMLYKVLRIPNEQLRKDYIIRIQSLLKNNRKRIMINGTPRFQRSEYLTESEINEINTEFKKSKEVEIDSSAREFNTVISNIGLQSIPKFGHNPSYHENYSSFANHINPDIKTNTNFLQIGSFSRCAIIQVTDPNKKIFNEAMSNLCITGKRKKQIDFAFYKKTNTYLLFIKFDEWVSDAKRKDLEEYFINCLRQKEKVKAYLIGESIDLFTDVDWFGRQSLTKNGKFKIVDTVTITDNPHSVISQLGSVFNNQKPYSIRLIQDLTSFEIFRHKKNIYFFNKIWVKLLRDIKDIPKYKKKIKYILIRFMKKKGMYQTQTWKQEIMIELVWLCLTHISGKFYYYANKDKGGKLFTNFGVVPISTVFFDMFYEFVCSKNHWLYGVSLQNMIKCVKACIGLFNRDKNEVVYGVSEVTGDYHNFNLNPVTNLSPSECTHGKITQEIIDIIYDKNKEEEQIEWIQDAIKTRQEKTAFPLSEIEGQSRTDKSQLLPFPLIQQDKVEFNKASIILNERANQPPAPAVFVSALFLQGIQDRVLIKNPINNPWNFINSLCNPINNLLPFT